GAVAMPFRTCSRLAEEANAVPAKSNAKLSSERLRARGRTDGMCGALSPAREAIPESTGDEWEGCGEALHLRIRQASCHLPQCIAHSIGPGRAPGSCTSPDSPGAPRNGREISATGWEKSPKAVTVRAPALRSRSENARCESSPTIAVRIDLTGA